MVQIGKSAALITGDSLNLNPMFVNRRTGAFSRKISDLYSKPNRKLSRAGIISYMSFGYSAFGLTPIEDVFFIQPNKTISIDTLENGSIDDPWLERATEVSNPERIFENIKEWVNKWEESFDGEIVLPLSGGYDSRLLLWAINDKKRVRAFTYGLNSNKENSEDVVIAQNLASRMGVNWQQIKLGDYHQHLTTWNEIYDVSVHAHGMYQIAFYEQIKAKVSPRAQVLSGVIGDLWAGSIEVPEIKKPGDLIHLGLSRGMEATQLLKSHPVKGQTLLNEIPELIDFYSESETYLSCPKFRVLSLIRTKMQLLRYLVEVPEYLGLETHSPFLSQEIGFQMLRLDESHRHNRNWQTKFFESEKLSLNDNRGNPRNSLNLDEIIGGRIPCPSQESIEILAGDLECVKINMKNFNHIFTDLFRKRTALAKYFVERVSSKSIFRFSYLILSRTLGKAINPTERLLQSYFSYLCMYPLMTHLENVKLKND